MSEPANQDGLRLAVLNNRFEGVVRAMMNTLLRSARSAILNTARDFSCCVLTAEGEMLAMAESLPIHVMSGPDLMARNLLETHPDLRRGDAYLNNSPYHGNSHAADWSLLVPVVDDAGVHRYTVLAKAHLADCGNAVPTTYSAGARDVYEEGALIFPCVKVQEDYRDREDVLGDGAGPDPRARALVRRLPRPGRGGADRRAPPARPARRGRPRRPRELRARLVRLQRGALRGGRRGDAGRDCERRAAATTRCPGRPTASRSRSR